MPILLFFLGVASGAGALVLWSRAHRSNDALRLATAREQLQERQQELEALRFELSDAAERRAELQADAARLTAELEAERRAGEKQMEAFEQARRQLADQFGTLSAEALERNNRTFIDLALASLDKANAEARGELEQRTQSVEQMVQPLKDSLKRVDEQLHALEVARADAYASLGQQVRSLGESQERLRSETASLVNALRAPSIRGRWGEMQLRRAVEAAGMVSHCDFEEQVTVVDVDGTLRPDMIVRLPGNKQIVVDAKVPLQAYLEAAESNDLGAQRTRYLDHARQVRKHIDALSAKSYWSQFENSPDVVVLFIPGEAFLASACDHDATLFEHAASNRILLATPTTLIALLQAVAFGWRQDALADNARAICEVGRELYERLCTMSGHVAKVGRSLDRAVDAYNSQVASLESRVLVSARKLANLEVSNDELGAPDPIEKQTRALQAAELTRLSPVANEIDDHVA